MAAWKPDVRFRKSAKIYARFYCFRLQATDIYNDNLYIFMGTWRDSAVGIVFRRHRLHSARCGLFLTQTPTDVPWRGLSLSVLCHASALSKNRKPDRDAVRSGDWCGSKKQCIRWGTPDHQAPPLTVRGVPWVMPSNSGIYPGSITISCH